MGVDECGLVIGNEVPASMLFCRDEALRVILVLLKDHGQVPASAPGHSVLPSTSTD
jgi:citrate synthase